METLSSERLTKYREQTHRTSASLRLRNASEAVRFVEQRGFILFWPAKGVVMPSLWCAVAGDRPVPDEHDDPAHVTWSWKDELLDKRVWYYARILKKRNTLISNDSIPYFYALSNNFGDPEAEINEQYYQGLLPMEAKSIFETLLEKGPLDSITLRREAHLTGQKSNAPFTRALDLLQKELKVLPVAVTDAGTWHYAFVYDLTHRYHPELLEKSRYLTEKQARVQLARLYMNSVGAATPKQIRSLFGWTEIQTADALQQLERSGVICQSIELEDSKIPLACLTELIG